MRPWLGCLCRLIFCLTSVCLVFGQAEAGHKSVKSIPKTKTNKSIPAALLSEIMANEKAVWEAAKLRDMRRFDALVADDARMVFTSGIMTKQEYANTAARRTITDYSLTNFQAFMPAEGTVITLYQATVSGTSDGKAFPTTTMRESSVWIQRGSKWVAVWNQETPIH
jgi:hypothetical protein